MYLLPRRTLPPIDGLPIAPESQPDDAPKPKPNYLGTKPPPLPPAPPSMMPNATPNQNAGKYLLPRNNMPIPVAPEPEQPSTPRPSYLGTRPLLLPNVPNIELGSMPNQTTNIPLPLPPAPEPPSPVGRMPILTNSRNASGITPPPAVTPQQSDDLDGLGNTAKVVRGSEQQGGYLGTRPTLDPLGQARQEAGSLKKLGFWGRLGQVGKGALLGALNSGGGDLSTVLGGALGGGILGGTDTLRKNQREQQIQQRAGEIGQAKAYERQARLDNEQSLYNQTRVDNILFDNKNAQDKLNETINQHKTQIAQRDKELQLRDEQEKTRRASVEKWKKIKSLENAVNQPGQKPEVRTQLIGQLRDLGMDFPDGYDPQRDKVIFQHDPETGQTYAVNLSQGTSQYIQAPSQAPANIVNSASPTNTTNGQPLKITPKPTNVSEGELQKRVTNDLYSSYAQQYPNGVPNKDYQEKAAALAKQASQDRGTTVTPDDPSVARGMSRRYPKLQQYTPIEKSQEFRSAVAGEITKQRGGILGSRSKTNKGQQVNRLENDLRIVASQIKNNPTIAAGIVEALTKDHPGVDIKGKLNKLYPGLVQ